MRKPRVLTLLGAWWPAHEATGPNQSVRAMVNALDDEFDFRIVGRDRAYRSSVRLTRDNGWTSNDIGRVRYLAAGPSGPFRMVRTVRTTPHEVLYLNSFMDLLHTAVPLLDRRLDGGRRRILLAPRGEFSPGALALKGRRKRAYIEMTKRAGLIRRVIFQATSTSERDDISRVFADADVRLVPNFRALPPLIAHRARVAGRPLRVVFVGRVARVKGLHRAIEALAHVRRPVHFDIFGPHWEADYLDECLRRIAELPENVTTRFAGAVPFADVPEIMANADLMFLPSTSENFGHGIFDALAAGTPVLVGPNTPWRRLAEQKAGYDLPLEDKAGFAKAIDRFFDFSEDERGMWRDGARTVAANFVRENDALLKMRALLHEIAADAG